MGLFGFGKKKKQKEQVLVVEVSFDEEFWSDEIYLLDEFLDEFGDMNDEYELTKREIINQDIYYRIYEFVFDDHTIECKEDGTVLLSHGKYSSEPLRAVGRIHDQRALDLLKSGTVTRVVPNISGGNYREYSFEKDKIVKGEDPVLFQVDIYYRNETP